MDLIKIPLGIPVEMRFAVCLEKDLNDLLSASRSNKWPVLSAVCANQFSQRDARGYRARSYAISDDCRNTQLLHLSS